MINAQRCARRRRVPLPPFDRAFWPQRARIAEVRSKWEAVLPLTRVEHRLDPIVNFPVREFSSALMKNQRAIPPMQH